MTEQRLATMQSSVSLLLLLCYYCSKLCNKYLFIYFANYIVINNIECSASANEHMPIFDITVKSNSKVEQEKDQQEFFIHFTLKKTPMKSIHKFEMEEIMFRGPLQNTKQCYSIKKLAIDITPQTETVWATPTAKPDERKRIKIRYTPNGGRSWCHTIDNPDFSVEKKFENHLVEYKWSGSEPMTYMVTLRLLLGLPEGILRKRLPSREKRKDLVHYVILMVGSIGEHPSTKLPLLSMECSWKVSKKLSNLTDSFEEFAHSSPLQCSKDNRDCCGFASGTCAFEKEKDMATFLRTKVKYFD